MKKILLIGCGHMGGALLSSWINSKKYSLTVVDPVKYKYLKKKYYKKITISKNISNIKKNIIFDYIVFAIRPIDLNNVLNELSDLKLTNKTSIISIIAGKKIDLFKNKFKKINNFFRVMPNMPALIGEGMNCIVSNKKASKIKANEVKKLFSYSGKIHFLQNENQIDMATAISGSGPGYVFNLIDAFEKAAIQLGFSKNISKVLVSQTFKGSIDLLLRNKISAEELVNTVATKGGTTEAGLQVMNKNKLHRTFRDLTKASYKKAKDQGKLNAKK